VRYDFNVPRTLFVHGSGSFDLYAPFFESVCGMRRTDDETQAGVVLGNEFELKKQIAVSGWRSFQPHARVLFLPGVVFLDDKIELARMLADAPYHPRTYVDHVPEGKHLKGWWIDKPARGSSGRGIRIIHNPAAWKAEGHVLQQYVDNPLLHRGRFKFDLRILGVVFSDGHVFVYPDAVMRCCGVPYVPLAAAAQRVRVGTQSGVTNRVRYASNRGRETSFTLPAQEERAHLTNVCVQAKYDSTQSHVDILSSHTSLYETLMPKATGVILDVLNRWFQRVHEHMQPLARRDD